MKKKFSLKWKESKQPRKQRKFRHNAPLHVRGKFLAANLAKELREKHSCRSVRVRKGDKVRIMRGQFRGKDGKVEQVDLKKSKVYISKIEVSKRDGSKARIPIAASNVQIIELDMSDKRRSINKKKTGKEKNGKESS